MDRNDGDNSPDDISPTCSDVDAADLAFDFEGFFNDYFSLIKQRDRGDAHREELDAFSEQFDARVIGMFCRDTIAGIEPPRWVSLAIVEGFLKVLHGNEWNDSFPLPWNPRTPLGTRAEQKAVEIYCDIANQLNANQELKITDLLNSAAEKFSVSYETARAAYYAMKNKLKAKEGQHLKLVQEGD